MTDWVDLGTDRYGNKSMAMVGVDYVTIEVYYRHNQPPGNLALTHPEALSLVCLLPEVKELLRVTRRAYENYTIHQDGYAALDRGLDEEFRDALKPFEGKGEKDD